MLSFALVTLLCVLACPFANCADNLGLQSYDDEEFILYCQSGTTLPLPTDTLTWTRHGSSVQLTTDDHFELLRNNGVLGGKLRIKKVTEDLSGIYLCRIEDVNNKLVDTVVKGVNLGPPKYREYIDKYRENLTVGGIAGGAMLVFIISIGLISHFRYLDEASLEKRRQRKSDRLQHKHNAFGATNTYYENGGTEMTEAGQTNPVNTESSYVHF